MIKQANSFSIPLFARLLFQNRKQAGLYGGLFLIIVVNLGLLLSINVQRVWAAGAVKFIPLGCFTLMGIANIHFFYKRNFLSAFSFWWAKPAYTVLLFLLMVLVLFIYYFVTGNNHMLLCIACSAAFLLPLVVYLGWAVFSRIPAKQYPVWRLPRGQHVESDVYCSNAAPMHLQFKIARRPGLEEHIFPMAISGKMKLGRVFEKFIAEQSNEGNTNQIEINGEPHQPIGWQFILQKWGGIYYRHLQPNRSLLENNIASNSIIIAKRIIIN